MSSKLKPCPKCGNRDIYFLRPTPFGTPAVWIATISCSCGITFNIHTKDKQEAISAWNKRS
ncbi:MAG: Lar family restriction alleviation protein [Elusimicrobiaceae bacterium]|nr:Lar family restriction alleviation protein [Elusimicrobiaceae bacterium]